MARSLGYNHLVETFQFPVAAPLLGLLGVNRRETAQMHLAGSTAGAAEHYKKTLCMIWHMCGH